MAVVKISEAATFPVNTEVVGGNPLTIGLQEVGDLIIVDYEIHSHTVTVTAVSCPETGTWHLAKR